MFLERENEKHSRPSQSVGYNALTVHNQCESEDPEGSWGSLFIKFKAIFDYFPELRWIDEVKDN